MMLAFVLILALYCLVVHVLVVISAFKQSVGHRLLSAVHPNLRNLLRLQGKRKLNAAGLYSFAVLINISSASSR